MDFTSLGLIHPEWDSEIEDDEFARLSKPDPTLGTLHRLSPTMHGHLPHNIKVQLTLQQKRIDILGGHLLKRLEEVLASPTVEGGCFYNESVGRDIAALCKAIERSYTSFQTRLPRPLRRAVIEVLFDFVTRHANPELYYHPKALRAATTLLTSLLQQEAVDLESSRIFKSLRKHGLVPPIDYDFPPLKLDWRPLYALARIVGNLDGDRKRPGHYYGTAPLAMDTLDELAGHARFFYPAEGLSEILETIFPLLSSKPEATLETFAISSTKSNTELVDYMLRITKDFDLTLLSAFLPVYLDSPNIDVTSFFDQVLNLWRLVPAALGWDRTMINILSDLVQHHIIRWTPSQARMLLNLPFRQRNIATGGTPLATPGHGNDSAFFVHQVKPLGTALGNLIACMLVTDEQYEKSLKDTSINASETVTGVFLQWMNQIETYLHPNSASSGSRTLKNVLLGLVSTLTERYNLAIDLNDFADFASTVKEFSTERQGIYDSDLPTFTNGSVENFIVKESTWDALAPVFDRLRVLLVDSSLGRNMSFLLAHVRPQYIHSSIFPRVVYALENPMLDGKLNVPVALQILTSLVPLLFGVPGAPAKLTELMFPLLTYVDPNDPGKAEKTFKLVTAIMIAIVEHKKGLPEHSSHYLKQIDAITLPSELASTLVGKSFKELKNRLLHRTKPVKYRAPLVARPADSSDEDTSSQLSSELLTLDSVLCDWIVEFFEQVLAFIEGVPPGSASSTVLVHCMKHVLEFAILGGESLFNILLRSLTTAVTTTPRAKTDLNALVDAFSRVRPGLVLHACFESWLTDLKTRGQRIKAGKKQLDSEADVMSWKLDLLRLILKRSGSSVGSHEKTLLAIIEPLLQDENKSIKRAALHVLTAALGPMKPSFNDNIDPAASGKFNTFVDVLLYHASFCEPTIHSLELAARWSKQFVRPAIEALKDATELYRDAPSAGHAKKDEHDAAKPVEKKDEASTSAPLTVDAEASAPSEKLAPVTSNVIAPPKDLNDQLHLLFEFLTALGPVLPTKQPEAKSVKLTISQHLPYPEESPAATNDMVVKEEAAIKQRKALIPPPLVVFTHITREARLSEELKELRWDILFAIQEFIALAILSNRCQDPKTVRRAMKVVTQALVHNGAKDNKWTENLSRLSSSAQENASETPNAKSKAASATKGDFTLSYDCRRTNSPLHPYYHQWAGACARDFIQARWLAARSKLQFGEIATGLVRAYVRLSSNHLELVGSLKLGKLMLGNIPRFGGSIPFLNGLLLKVISQPLNPNQSLTSFAALLGLVSAPATKPNLTANWKNFAHFIKTIRGLHIHNHALLQQGIVRLYASVMEQLPFRAATPLQDRNFFLSYADLADSLLADLSTDRPAEHWRYHLYSLITLVAILRRNIHTPGKKFVDAPPAVAALGLTQSTSESIQMSQENLLRSSASGSLNSEHGLSDSLSRQISNTSIGLTESQDASFQPVSLVASAVGSEAMPPAPKSALSRYRPGLDGLAVLQALVPVTADVLPTARHVSRFVVTRMLTWAQDAEDTSHAETVAPLLEENQMNVLLGNLMIERQSEAQRDPLQGVIGKLVFSAGALESMIGDAEFGVGMEMVQFGTFSLRVTDFWFRLFNSLKFSSASKEECLKVIAAFIVDKIHENLTPKKTAPSSASPAPVSASPAPVAAEPASLSSNTPEIQAPIPVLASKLVADVSESPAPIVEAGPLSATVAAKKSPTEPTTAEKTAPKKKPTTAAKTAQKKKPATPSPEHVEEMETYFFCIAEALVGFTRAFPEEAQNNVWPAILSGARLSSKRLSSLLFGLSYLVHYNINLNNLEQKILEPIMRDASELGSLSVFDVEARLALALCYYQESRYAKLESLANLVQYLFIERYAAAFPKPQIRTMAYRLLTLLTATLTRSPYATDATTKKAVEIHDRVIETLLESAAAETLFEGNNESNADPNDPQSATSSVATTTATATGSSVPVTPQERVKLTLISWISECLEQRIDIVASSKWWTRLMEASLELSVDPATAVAKAAEKVLIRLAQVTILPFSELEQVELMKQAESIRRLSEHPRWKARTSMCLALRLFLCNHSIMMPLSDRTDFLNWEKHLVEDSHVEVRKAATAALSSSIHSLCLPDEEMKQVAAYFLDIVSKNSSKARTKAREGKDDAAPSTEIVNALTAATSGLVAIASAIPYSVPSWLPPVVIALQRLSTHSNGTVAGLASDAIVQFWKTHRDEWHFHQVHFTASELQLLEDKPVPSYYA